MVALHQRLREVQEEAQSLQAAKTQAELDVMAVHASLDDATHEIDLADKRSGAHSHYRRGVQDRGEAMVRVLASAVFFASRWLGPTTPTSAPVETPSAFLPRRCEALKRACSELRVEHDRMQSELSDTRARLRTASDEAEEACRDRDAVRSSLFKVCSFRF